MINVQIIKQRANSYFSAKQVADNGRLNTKTIALRFPDHFGDTIQPASVFSIEGEVENRTYEVNDFPVNEDFIEVTEAKMLKPSTRLIEAWLMKNIDGVGQVKAGKFARHQNFEKMVISNDFDALRSLTNNEEVAAQILKKFPRDELLEAVNWLASKKLPTKVAVRLVDIWKERTLEQIQQNPFCLMQFNVSYKKCLELALECGFEETDDICQSAFIVDIVNQYSGRSGSTGAPLSAIKRLSSARNVSDISSALRASGRLSQAGLVNNIVQTEGNFLIEHEVATKLKAALNRGDGKGSLLAGWETDLRQTEINYALNEFEKSIPFSLTNEQKAVVTGSLRNKVCCLSGGAGTGKTTILKAILEVTDKVAHGIEKQLLALSGKAAQRMTEVTGIQASTIAKFCINFKTKKPPDHMLVVLDEASMIDVYSMHKLLMILPSTCRLIFVGDVEQLPPVGGGLVFHSLMKSDFPKFELKQVQRQSSDSKIHKFATSVRNEEPNIELDNYFSDPESECSFLNTDDASWIKQTYFELGGIENTVVLCPTQRGKGGVREVNNAIQRAIGLDRK